MMKHGGENKNLLFLFLLNNKPKTTENDIKPMKMV